MPSNPTFDPGPCNTTLDSESEEPRIIGDFNGSASEFWKLFIFVRSYSVCAITGLVILMRGSTGWFIFCRSHSIRG
jgi:hypothetical protein